MVAADEREDLANAGAGPPSTTATRWPTPSRRGGRYDLRHGEAVAIGLVYAAELAHRLGRIDAARVAEHRRVVAAYDLPTDAARRASTPTSCSCSMARDKKAVDGLTFVLDGPAGSRS